MSALPSTPFTPIDSTRVAVDAPVSTDLMTDICVDLNYLANFGGGKNFACFTTPGAGTWTVPSGVYSCVVEMVGGGGGGSNGSSTFSSGGGSGAYQIYQFTGLVPGTVMNLFVGTGGTQGVNGTASWFNTSGTGAAGGGGASSGSAGVGGTPVNSATIWGTSTGGGSINIAGGGIYSGWGGVAGGPFGGRLAGMISNTNNNGENARTLGGGGAGGNGTGGGGTGGNGAIIIRF